MQGDMAAEAESDPAFWSIVVFKVNQDATMPPIAQLATVGRIHRPDIL